MISQLFRNLRNTVSGLRGLDWAVSVLRQPVLLTSVVVTGLVLTGQQLGLLQPAELTAFDQMVRLRPDSGPDPRLLIVTITENDLAKYSFPISDRTLAQLLKKLQQYQPRVIGLDLFRYLPQEPGHIELIAQFRQPNLIAITKIGTEENLVGVPRPPSIPPERAGFNDVVTDPDGVIRRNWIFGYTETTNFYSFALQLAQHYLAAQGILPQPSWPDSERIEWGKAVFTPLEPGAGGYQNIDSAGYQLLLNYRSARNVARQVTLSQVLNQEIDGSWVKDKIVLIGTTAPSIRDVFFTPYSAAQQNDHKMPGVLIHAQMVSQLIDAVSGDRPLLRFWPVWSEGFWIGAWALVGGVMAWYMRHPLQLGLLAALGLGGLGAASFGLLTQAIWVPVVAPAFALILTEAGILAYIAYQAQQERKAIVQQAQNQEKTIALLQTLLTENTRLTESTRPMTEITRPNEMTNTSMGSLLVPLEAEANSVFKDEVVVQVIDTSRNYVLLSQRYKLMRILGSGGFGLTYLAEDIQRPGHPACVVKQLLPARSDAKFLHTARRLFRTEAEILEKLGRHSQIPHLLASFEENGKFYLVEEFIKGFSLNDELGTGKRFSEAQVVELLKDLLEVLIFIHSYQVIHRDIKPSNIIRREHDNRLVLIDFGAVKQMQPPTQTEQENPTVAIGTRGYAPPEQMAGHPGLNSDIYALGMIAIQALTGVFPQQLQQHPDTGTVVWRHLVSIRADLADIINKMVHYYFNERYQSAIEVLHDLKKLTVTPVDKF